jgi:hypothetical protein
MIASQGYSRIGLSLFETNWPAPHRDEAAQMGRKLGADLVLYIVVPAGTRLQSVPHVTYEPGQTYTGTTTGVVGGTFGSLQTNGSSPGSLRTHHGPAGASESRFFKWRPHAQNAGFGL